MSDNSQILQPLINAVTYAGSEMMLNKLGLAVIDHMETRTEQGIDIDGSKFQEYSAGYKKLRQKMGLPVDPVNLQVDDVTGMRAGTDFITNRNSVLVYIKGSRNRRIARYHNIMGAGKPKIIRKYWGLNEQEQQQVVELVGIDFAARLRGAL